MGDVPDFERAVIYAPQDGDVVVLEVSGAAFSPQRLDALKRQAENAFGRGVKIVFADAHFAGVVRERELDTVDRSRLYGLPGAMSLHHALDDAIEEACAYVDENRPAPVIEEYTVHEPQHHLPAAGAVVEWCVETTGDHETDEDAYDAFVTAGEHPDVVRAFQTAINVLASKVNYRMSDELVAVWHPPDALWPAWKRQEVPTNGAS